MTKFYNLNTQYLVLSFYTTAQAHWNWGFITVPATPATSQSVLPLQLYPSFHLVQSWFGTYKHHVHEGPCDKYQGD